MSNELIKMGQMPRDFMDGGAQTLTFCVTEECNLRCKYCYMCRKNNQHRMSFETAKKAVDYFLSCDFGCKYVVWDFIGGEPTLEIELIDQISDYIKEQMYIQNHPWFNHYMFNMGSNGLLYHTPKVQEYIKKNYGHLSFSITIDGTKEKHDLQRVKPNGAGSYDDIIDNVRLWIKQFPGQSTKVTFASEDLIYLKDSIVHLWDLGINVIPANVVYEDVWRPGDDIIFKKQLYELADYILENNLWKDYSVRFFDPNVGFPMGKHDKSINFCGTGKMVAVSPEGDFYPCVRFIDFCSNDAQKPPMIIGNVDSGLDEDKRKMFKDLNIDLVNDAECNQCETASLCFSCAACNYDNSEFNTIFNRTKYHCQMQKVQAEVNEYFWGELAKKIDFVTPHEESRYRMYEANGWKLDGAKYLYLILSDDMVSHCMYETSAKEPMPMTAEMLGRRLDFAHANNMIPVFLGNPDGLITSVESRKVHLQISRADPNHKLRSSVEKYIPVYNVGQEIEVVQATTCILSVQLNNRDQLEEALVPLCKAFKRVNIVLQDLFEWNEDDIKNTISFINTLKEDQAHIYGNVFIDNLQSGQCDAGLSEFALAPNGKFYICPGFYFSCPEMSIGNIDEGLNHDELLILKKEKSPSCSQCDYSKCVRCPLGNYMETKQLNYPAHTSCLITKALSHQA